MKISLIIPARNEENCIGRLLEEIPREVVNEVIVIDGHSKDNTFQEAKMHLKPQDKLVKQKGLGYGRAFLQGFKLATGDVIALMDADGSHNPKDLHKIIKKIKQGYEYVMASRYVKGGRSDDDTLIRFLGNMIFTRLINLIHHANVTDSLYLYTAIKRDALDKLKLQSPGFEFCTEIIVNAHYAGLKFAEVPAIERPRFAGKSKVNAFWHGLKILKMILRRYPLPKHQ
jgi:glycosyltransferase involved in cell wall biosynthesis